MRLYKTLLWKAYFDKGMAMMNYPIKVLMVLGIGAAFNDYSLFGIGIFGFIIGILALIIGRLWFHYRLIETEIEINNIFNPFCQEVRKKLKTKRNLN